MSVSIHQSNWRIGKKIQRTCQNQTCGLVFLATHSDAKYCSPSCAATERARGKPRSQTQLEADRKYQQKRNKKAERHARICLNCDKPFVTPFSEKLCCSRSCTEAQWRKNNSVRLIKAEHVQAEEREMRQSFPPVPRPTRGKRCSCGRVLYHYEAKYENCLQCRKQGRAG